MATSATCIGIDIEEGRYLAPHAQSMIKYLASLVHMRSLGSALRISPLQLGALLGLAQWHAQLNRPTYSIFYHVYDFVRGEPGDVPVKLPENVWQEIVLFSCVLPCLEADLARPWLPELLASDASAAFGFGVQGRADWQSWHSCFPDVSWQRHRLGHHLILMPGLL